MKFKIIAAACAVLCSASAFSITVAPVLPATQAPELTFFIGGASAQQAALTIAAQDLFDTTAFSVATIKQAVPPAGSPQYVVDNQKATTGWYGMSKAALTGGISKRLFVVYNNANGSNAGVAQVLTTAVPPTETEAKVVTLDASCALAGTTYTCNNTAVLEADMALSDVRPEEAVPGVLPTGAGTISIGQLTVKPTALEGFGVVVNPALYAALQTAQGLVGCAGNTSAACQPSIRRADYASLVTLDGTIKDAAGLLGNPADTTPLTLERRVDSSGSQAASNIFFANNVCGTLGYLGALTPVGKFDSNPGVFDIVENSTTGDIKLALTGTTTAGYALGVVSLENVVSPAATAFQYVKIDGVSPNFSAAGLADPKQRNAFASGSYPFATAMTAMYRTAAPVVTKALGDTIIAGLKDSTKHDLAGIAYLDGTAYTVGGKVSRVSRGVAGNNCQPLIN